MSGIPWWTTDIGGFHGGGGLHVIFRLFCGWAGVMAGASREDEDEQG